MKKGLILWLSILVFALKAQAQQDAQITQYLFNGLYINPAYAGYKEDVYIQSYFRSQWVGLTGAPKSFAIAMDGTFSENVGLGGTISSDKIGAQSSLAAYLNYAYRIRVGQDEDSHLAFGLAAGLMQLSLDGSQLHAVTQGDNSVPVASQSMAMPDANVGIYYANSKWFTGFSATNILARYVNPNSAANLLVPIPQPHFYLTGGTFIPLNDDVVLKPVILIKDDLKGPTTIDFDAFIILNERLTFGGFYRASAKLYQKNLQNDLPKQNSFGVIADFFVTPGVRVGYSYDHTMNSFSAYNSGSHELSIGFYLNGKNRLDRSNAFRCFKF